MPLWNSFIKLNIGFVTDMYSSVEKGYHIYITCMKIFRNSFDQNKSLKINMFLLFADAYESKQEFHVQDENKNQKR